MKPILALLAAVFLFVPARTASAQNTAFTYQGRLNQSGLPAEGSFDLRFTLFDADVAGNTVAGPLALNAVPVTNGLFTVPLDFGLSPFNGSPRFLGVEVRPAGSGAFTLLAPRQAITPAPYALKTLGVSGSSLGAPDGSPASALIVDNSGNVAIGTNVPAARLHLVNGDLLAGAPGAEWIFHTRSHVGSDFLQITDSDNGLYQFQRGLILHENGNVGIRTTAPRSALEVRGDVRLGATGDLRAASGEENLRILRGQISNSGIAAGSGFSVARTGAGRYTITFTTPYAGVPSVTVTAMDTSPTPAFVPTANVVSVSSTGFSVACHTVNNGGGTTLSDLSVQFIAAGPR